eukprot:gene2298-4469_t
MGSDKVHKIASTTFTINDKYKDLKVIGQGSYGVVCSAFDTNQKKNVAIKKITPMTKHTSDAKHVIREIRLMRHMGKHENIVSLDDLIVRETADELYIVMELMDSDLHRVIQSPQILTESHYRHFMHQLLCGVKYLHDNSIIHRDLKPGNLLITRDCKLRITDFGLSRGINGAASEPIDEPMTEHVVTRWYRSPELMLCPDGLYTYAVDVWSCGCIMAEMLRRRPLFPGKNFIEQLTLIFDVIGAPKPHETVHIHNDQAVKYLASQALKQKVALDTLFHRAPVGSLDLMDRLLLFTPEKRPSVDEALESSFFTPISTSSLIAPSLVFPPVSSEFEFNFENEELSKFQLKQIIMKEVNSFHRERHPQRQETAATTITNKNNSNNNIVGPSISDITNRRTASANPVRRRASVDGANKSTASSTSTSSTAHTIANTRQLQHTHTHTATTTTAGGLGLSRPVSSSRVRTGSNGTVAAFVAVETLAGNRMGSQGGGQGGGIGARPQSNRITKTDKDKSTQGSSEATRKMDTRYGKPSATLRHELSEGRSNGKSTTVTNSIPNSPARKNISAQRLLDDTGGQAMVFLSPGRYHKQHSYDDDDVSETHGPTRPSENPFYRPSGSGVMTMKNEKVMDDKMSALRRKLEELDKDALIDDNDDDDVDEEDLDLEGEGDNSEAMLHGAIFQWSVSQKSALECRPSSHVLSSTRDRDRGTESKSYSSGTKKGVVSKSIIDDNGKMSWDRSVNGVSKDVINNRYDRDYDDAPTVTAGTQRRNSAFRTRKHSVNETVREKEAPAVATRGAVQSQSHVSSFASRRAASAGRGRVPKQSDSDLLPEKGLKIPLEKSTSSKLSSTAAAAILTARSGSGSGVTAMTGSGSDVLMPDTARSKPQLTSRYLNTVEQPVRKNKEEQHQQQQKKKKQTQKDKVVVSNMASAEAQIKRKWEILELERQLKWEQERLKSLAQSRKVDGGSVSGSGKRSGSANNNNNILRSSSAGRTFRP